MLSYDQVSDKPRRDLSGKRVNQELTSYFDNSISEWSEILYRQ